MMQVVYAIEEVAKRIIGMDVEKMFSDMGAFWEFCTSCLDRYHQRNS
jgi:L-fuconate dehydratase